MVGTWIKKSSVDPRNAFFLEILRFAPSVTTNYTTYVQYDIILSNDQDCDEFAKDGYWPIVIFTAIIQFGLQIWGSIVLFGYGSNWQYNNKRHQGWSSKQEVKEHKHITAL
jgi:hypothetical protein